MSKAPRPAGARSAEADRAELLERLLRQRRIELPETRAIPRRAKSSPCPLSCAQQRMWSFSQLERDSPIYNLLVGPLGISSRPCAIRWVGMMDVGVLEQSLDTLLRRHDVLRARFPLTEWGVVQEAAPAGTFHLPVIDLTGVSAGDRESRARDWVFAEARRPFDLQNGPPLRATLLRLTGDEHVLALVIHNIVFDRWSRGVLLRELAVVYSAFTAGQPSPLAEPAIRYQDYVHWQREHLQSEVLKRELAYWKQQLTDAPAVLALPTDRPRPAAQTYGGARLSLPLPADLTRRLHALSSSNGATLFMGLLAAFQALLARYTEQTDVVVGTPIAGRTRVELEDLIGCFTNTLVLRTDLSGDPTFRDLLERVRLVALTAYANQELPFEKLVEEVRPVSDRRHHPIFQVLFNYLDVPRRTVELPRLRLEDFEVDLRTAPAELSLDIERSGERFTCYFTYNTDLFEAPTVARLAADYQLLLEAVTADPERRLSELPLRSGEALG